MSIASVQLSPAPTEQRARIAWVIRVARGVLMELNEYEASVRNLCWPYFEAFGSWLREVVGTPRCKLATADSLLLLCLTDQEELGQRVSEWLLHLVHEQSPVDCEEICGSFRQLFQDFDAACINLHKGTLYPELILQIRQIVNGVVGLENALITRELAATSDVLA